MQRRFYAVAQTAGCRRYLAHFRHLSSAQSPLPSRSQHAFRRGRPFAGPSRRSVHPAARRHGPSIDGVSVNDAAPGGSLNRLHVLRLPVETGH